MPKLKQKSQLQKLKVDSQRKKSNRLILSLPHINEVKKSNNTTSRRSKRLDPKVRQMEQDSNTALRKLKRMDKNIRHVEQDRNTKWRQLKRLDSKFRNVEQTLDTAARKRKRLNPEFKQLEQTINTTSMKGRRLDSKVRNAEQTLDTIARKRTRVNAMTRKVEQDENSKRRYCKRNVPTVRMVEQQKNTISRRISRKYGRVRAENTSRRQNKRITNEQVKDTIRRSKYKKIPEDFAANENNFNKAIKDGPTWICSSCGGLWFRTSVSQVDPLRLKCNGMCDEFLKSVLLVPTGTIHYLCLTCKKSVEVGKTPRLNLSNGLHFPEIPDCLKRLTGLEERLCALRLPFLQIRSLGVDRQCGLKGNVVHIQNDVDDAIAVLPRRFDETSIIQVQLMRHMDHERPYLFQAIRPARVLEAVKYLITTPIYIQEGATISDVWENRVEMLMLEPQKALPQIDHTKQDSDDEEYPEDLPVNPGGHETLFLGNDPSEIMKIAPGQGKKPMSLLNDLNGETASYPTIYGGQPRDFKVKLSYSEIAKSETRRFDKRCAVPHKLLHAYKILQNSQVANAVQLCLRKKSGNGITADQILDGNNVNKLVAHDAGFRLLKQVRTSPAYWEQKTKHICAMIRQLGIPSLFLTLSAAETQWSELLIILKRVLEGKKITHEVAMTLSYEEKADLIRRDPVTCSRFFDNRLRKAFTHLFRPKNGIFGKNEMVDFFWRIEFQHRGSPHAHMLLWLKNSPKYDPNEMTSIPKCATFIDKIISCESNVEGVIHQQHRHTKTCKRDTKDGVICRFHMPYPPLPQTMILQPYPSDYPKAAKSADKVRLAKVKLYLEDHRKNLPDIPFDDFLNLMTITMKEYIAAIRSNLKLPTVFLKRSTLSCYTNAYIPSLAKSWHANMDVQFILEPYGCAKYIASYISKSCGGISDLLKKAADQAKSGKLPLKEQFRKIANTFLNGSEVSAQEAVYAILSMPLTNCTRDVVFIPTGPPDERVFLVKSNLELQKLDGSSDKISVSGLLEHYSQRPDTLNEICLANFAANYKFSSKGRPSKPIQCEDHEFIQDFDTDDGLRTPFLPLKDKSGYIKKRRQARVIRFRRYGETTDRKNYCREQLMLYKPWRVEESELINIDVETVYEREKHDIVINRRDFNANINDLPMEKIICSYESSDAENKPDIEYEVMDGCKEEADIFREFFSEKNNNKHERIPSLSMIDQASYLNLIQSLNIRQMQYLCHVMDRLQENIQFNDFVFGGAGTGKSTEIKAIVQCVLRQYNIVAGCDPSTPKVILSAPTGKAAFNIRGSTLHQAFMLPLNQYSGPIPKISEDMCNTLACRLKDLKLLIIDEISMVSCEQLYQINSRMQQIFKNAAEFGGKSVIVFGDLHQLRPVGASYVFSNIKGDLGDLIGNPLWEGFKSYELTEIMRQKDDLIFAEALNRLSVGRMTSEDIELFRSREVKDEQPPSDAIRLFSDNRSVDEYNSNCLSKMTTESAFSEAFDLCQGKGKESWKTALLESVKHLHARDTMGLPKQVRLTVGAKYMVTLNVDVSDGLANGSTGTLKKISYGTTTDGRRIPTVAWMQFDEYEVGQVLKNKFRNLLQLNSVVENWIPIQLERRTIKTWPGRDLQAVRAQIPLTPSEAITVHKSQGATFDTVVVHLGKGMTRQALYVACSRARTLNGLYFVGEFKAPISKEDDVVELEMMKQKIRSLKFCYYSDPSAFWCHLAQCHKQTPPVNNNDSEPIFLGKTLQSIELTNKTLSPKLFLTTPVISSKKITPSRRQANESSPMVVQRIGNVSVYESDLNSLNPAQYLTDTIVDGYIELLIASKLSSTTVHNFGTFFHEYLKRNPQIAMNPHQNNWVNETSAQLLIFPICRNFHWTVVVADRSTSSIFEYDPLHKRGANIDILKDVSIFLNDIDGRNRSGITKWRIARDLNPEFPTQTNGYDCGLFICRFIEFLLRAQFPDFNQEGMSAFRIYVKKAIVNNRL